MAEHVAIMDRVQQQHQRERDETSKQLSRTEKRIRQLEQERDRLRAELGEKEATLQASREAYRRARDEMQGRSTRLGDEALLYCLRNNFGVQSFRPMQEEAIRQVMEGRDVVLLMPTGAGKSLCFQLPAVLYGEEAKIAIVVSPLVALMQDQCRNLRVQGIYAESLYHGCPKQVVSTVTSVLRNGHPMGRRKVATIAKREGQDHETGRKKEDGSQNRLCLVYVTPERIVKTKRFMSALDACYRRGGLSFIAIDECHCCSQWGHDFRPDYSKLGILRRQFASLPIIAVTATASPDVVRDVEESLSLRSPVLLTTPFNRPNLYYEVVAKEGPKASIIQIVSLLKERNYLNVRRIEPLKKNVTEVLQREGLLAQTYHAYLDHGERQMVHDRWKSGRINVVVATTAFGMGIDKSDVRWVIHHTMPKSLEGYYQESGRAGRDGLKAHCILMFRPADVLRCSVLTVMQASGKKDLESISEYAMNTRRCRRTVFAEAFSQQWEKASNGDSDAGCSHGCDVCDPSPSTSALCRNIMVVDMLPMAKLVFEILRAAVSRGKRLTFQMLLNCLRNEGSLTGLKARDMAQTDASEPLVCTNEEYGAWLVMTLLHRRHLKTDFVFNPYNTIVYLVLGEGLPSDTPYWTDVPFHFIDDPAVADQKKRKLKQRPSTGHRKRTRVDDRKQEREDSEGRAENDQILISSDSDSDFTSS